MVCSGMISLRPGWLAEGNQGSGLWVTGAGEQVKLIHAGGWMISCDDTLAARRATSNEEEGRANDDWKVLGFQSWLGGGASTAAGEPPAGLLQLEVGLVEGRLLKASLLFQCQSKCRGWGKRTSGEVCQGNILLIKK